MESLLHYSPFPWNISSWQIKEPTKQTNFLFLCSERIWAWMDVQQQIQTIQMQTMKAALKTKTFLSLDTMCFKTSKLTQENYETWHPERCFSHCYSDFPPYNVCFIVIVAVGLCSTHQSSLPRFSDECQKFPCSPWDTEKSYKKHISYWLKLQENMQACKCAARKEHKRTALIKCNCGLEHTAFLLHKPQGSVCLLSERLNPSAQTSTPGTLVRKL